MNRTKLSNILSQLGLRPVLLVHLILFLSCAVQTSTADDLLKPGRWKGEYQPADLGDFIDASYCVQRKGKKAWKITMQIDLPPPGNMPAQFKKIEETDEAISFKVNLLGAPRNCILDEVDGKDLIFNCELTQGGNGTKDRLTMRFVSAKSGGKCRIDKPDDQADESKPDKDQEEAQDKPAKKDKGKGKENNKDKDKSKK